MTRRTCAYALGPVLLLLVLVPMPLAAQRPPEPDPVRASRSLAIGNLARFESTTSVTAGHLYQITFRRSSVERMPAGNVVEHFPRYYAHLLGSAGAIWQDGESGLAAFGQLGIARRSDHATITTVAIAAQWVHRPRAYGPIARVEIMDNLGVQGGWLFIDGGGDGLFFSLDYMRDLLSDLGLR